MIQVLIDDTTIRLRRVLPAEFLDIGVLRVGTVRQTQFPVGIRLIHDAVQHLDLEFPFIVPQRNQNADLRHIREYRLFFLFPLLRIRKASGSVGLHQALLATLVADLTQDILGDGTMGPPTLSLCAKWIRLLAGLWLSRIYSFLFLPSSYCTFPFSDSSTTILSARSAIRN